MSLKILISVHRRAVMKFFIYPPNLRYKSKIQSTNAANKYLH